MSDIESDLIKKITGYNPENKNLVINFLKWLDSNHSNFTGFGNILGNRLFETKTQNTNRDAVIKSIIGEIVNIFTPMKHKLKDFIDRIESNGKEPPSEEKSNINCTSGNFVECICAIKDKDLTGVYKNFLEDVIREENEGSNVREIFNSNVNYKNLDFDKCRDFITKLNPGTKDEIINNAITQLDNCIKENQEKKEEKPKEETPSQKKPEPKPIDPSIAIAIAASIRKPEPKKKEEPPTPKPIPKEVPVKALSSDSITYVTPQGIVYIHNKSDPSKVYEYQGSLEDKKSSLREVKLNENDEIKINGVKLDFNNFKDLYPFITAFEEIETEPTTFFNNMLAASKWVLRDIAENNKS